jgi:aminopeptidase-like protein
MYNLIKKLIPLNRSIAGPANLLTLLELKKVNRKLNIKYFKSKKKVFDWEVPNEWMVKDAWIKKISGEKVLDFKKNNLHIVNYSIPKKETLIKLKDLKKKIFSIKEMPLAIPYITSYYKRNWGFCMAYSKLKNLKDEKYIIKIDSKIFPGKMNYGEILIKGKVLD